MSIVCRISKDLMCIYPEALSQKRKEKICYETKVGDHYYEGGSWSIENHMTSGSKDCDYSYLVYESILNIMGVKSDILHSWDW